MIKLPSYLPTKVKGTQPDEFTDFVKRPVLYIQTPWTSTSINTLVTTDIFKEYRNLAISTGYLGNRIKNFMFVDASLRVTFVVQGASAAQGTLIYAFDPRPNDPETGLSKISYPQRTRSLLIPHVEIDPSQSSTYTIDLPATSIWGTYSLGTAFEYGSYSMSQIVLNTLGSGTADTNDIAISIYLSLVNPIFHSATSYSEFSSSKEELTTKEGGVISSFFMKASEISAAASFIPVPFISEPATIFSAATGSLGKFFSWFGFSKPLAYDVTPVNIGVHNPYTKIDGRVLAEQMSLRSNNSVGISEDISPLLKLEDMICSELMRKPGLIDVFSFGTALASNAVFREIKVSPSLNLELNSPAIQDGFELTPLSFVAFPYRFWRGDITYKVKFVCSAFHRATVIILYDPRATTSTFVNPIGKSSLLKHWTVSICGNTEVEFTIPWSQYSDFLPIGSPDFDHSSLDCNGELIFAVLNPITTNGSIDPIHVNVYQSSSNMYLSDLIVNVTEMPTFVELASGKSDPTFYAKYFGEEPAHTIKELASVSSVEVRFNGDPTTLDGGTGYNFSLDSSPYIKPPYTTTALGVSVIKRLPLVDYLSMSYVGVRGSYIQHVFPNGMGEGILNAYMSKTKTSTNFAVSPGSLTLGWQTLGSASRNRNPALTTYIPYTHTGSFQVTGTLVGSRNQRHVVNLVNDTVQVAGVNKNTLRVITMKSAGEDFLFVGYRGTPVATYPQFPD